MYWPVLGTEPGAVATGFFILAMSLPLWILTPTIHPQMAKARTKKTKPSVSIIGPGRLGQALAIALQSSGYTIDSLVASSATNARKAAERLTRLSKPKLSKPVLALGKDRLSRLPPSNVILITTPDDAIEEVVQSLVACIPGRPSGSTVLHFSGALSSEILWPLIKVGFHVGSLHPLVSISEPRTGAEALHGAYYCLEGDRSAIQMARAIVSDLKGRGFSIPRESKALYHAAAVMASGHLVALLDLATEMLASCGLNRTDARKVLMPLVESTINNLKTLGSEAALTGTFARGDLATAQRHVSALSNKELAEALEVYKLLGLRSLQLANKMGLDPLRQKQMRKVLESAKDPKE